MDLEKELLAALENPEAVWGAMIQAFAPETRTALLVLATHKTPIEIAVWQDAVGRVDVGASTRFEASLRVLDDLFISTRRDHRGYLVDFRNPSMDDFCVDYIERNASIAIAIAQHAPSLQQVLRLVALGIARMDAGGSPRYPNLARALIASPDLLLNRLAAERGGDQTRALAAMADVLLNAGKTALATHRMSAERLRDAILAVDFVTDAGLLYALLDRRPRARLVQRILGPEFDGFYDRLWRSTRVLNDFDTLANLDEALNRSGEQAAWADRFESLVDGWIGGVTEAGEANSMRETYERVIDFLDVGQARLDDWDELIESIPRDAADDEYEPPYEPERTRSSSGSSSTSELLLALRDESHLIDAMFDGLKGHDRS